MKVYFAHPHRTIGTAEEKVLIREMEKRGWEVINPFENNPGEEIMGRIKRGAFSIFDAIELVQHDFASIGICTAVLVWLPNKVSTVGTICELVQAVKLRKATIVIHQTDRGRPHPWAAYYANQYYLTVQDFIDRKVVALV